ncbi:MAG: isoprenylcysteine carboxylmethyltransferase family protein [Rhodospirillales bacterium]|nr:isoprenylcysteine carboxylmethyltransferase family protein [Rhodospirillales bacterium]MDP7426250.1 isoprenylcysteine carboxylmethyltransferase family protein [Rhodospirillales bacterium]
MTSDSNDNPGVIAPPPLIFIAGLIVGFALDFFWPVPLVPMEIRIYAGGFIILISFVTAIWMMRLFIKARTNLDVRKPTHKIVTSGPFRWTRNPAYLSLSLLVLGIAIVADSIWVLLLLVVVMIVTHYKVILREEAYLEQKFGVEYLEYKASVRRWV